MKTTLAAAALWLAALSTTPLAAQQDDRWQITLDQDRSPRIRGTGAGIQKIFLYLPAEP